MSALINSELMRIENHHLLGHLTQDVKAFPWGKNIERSALCIKLSRQTFTKERMVNSIMFIVYQMNSPYYMANSSQEV